MKLNNTIKMKLQHFEKTLIQLIINLVRKATGHFINKLTVFSNLYLARLLLITLFLLLKSGVSSQNNESLKHSDCDTTTFYSYTEHPPKLNMSKDNLESLLNEKIESSIISKESMVQVYLIIIIDCQGNATYSPPSYIPDRIKRDVSLENQIIDLLSQKCVWSPGMKESTKKQKVPIYNNSGKQIGTKLQNINIFVNYQLSWEFNIKDGEITLITKINSMSDHKK